MGISSWKVSSTGVFYIVNPALGLAVTMNRSQINIDQVFKDGHIQIGNQFTEETVKGYQTMRPVNDDRIRISCSNMLLGL